jgi:hypothetical protein
MMRINQNGEIMRNPIFRWIHIEHELTGDSAKIKWLDEAQKRLFFAVSVVIVIVDGIYT